MGVRRMKLSITTAMGYHDSCRPLALIRPSAVLVDRSRTFTYLLFMSRFLFLASSLAASLAGALGMFNAQTDSNAQRHRLDKKLTSDAAVATVRSKQKKMNTSYQVIRELQSNSDTQEAARASLRAVLPRDGALYRGGIFVDLLKFGGFSILEVDTSGDVISLNLVSTEPNGKPIVDSKRVEGKVSAALARKLILNTSEVVDLLFADSINARQLESRFYDGHFPEFDGNEEDEYSNLFAVPRGVRRRKGDEGKISELSGLLGCIQFGWIRYAISTPLFPVDPARSLGSSGRKYEEVIDEFARSHDRKSDFIHEPVSTSEQLQARIATFTQLDKFMEQKMAPETYLSANRLISTVPLVLGATSTPQGVSYAVMTASGVIVAWKISRRGDLVVSRIGIAGD